MLVWKEGIRSWQELMDKENWIDNKRGGVALTATAQISK